MTTEYKHIYLFRNKDAGKYIFTYWASSQKHKAVFSSRRKAEEASEWIIKETPNIEIMEL